MVLDLQLSFLMEVSHKSFAFVSSTFTFGGSLTRNVFFKDKTLRVHENACFEDGWAKYATVSKQSQVILGSCSDHLGSLSDWLRVGTEVSMISLSCALRCLQFCNSGLPNRIRSLRQRCPVLQMHDAHALVVPEQHRDSRTMLHQCDVQAQSHKTAKNYTRSHRTEQR
jgi:hypothetical protein